MQLRLKPRNSKNLISKNLIIKTILVLLFLSLSIFLLDKINFPSPTKLIKQKISNEKLITLQ